MAKVRENRKVINNGPKTYREEYRGVMIEIPPRGYVVMERRDAVRFLGQPVFFDREKSKGEKPLSWGPANGEKPNWKPAEDAEPQEAPEMPYRNEATGRSFATEAEAKADLAGLEHLQLKED